MYDEEMVNLYTKFVLSRHAIWEARQAGESQPWTKDPILANRKFTNCFRVLDPGSQFVLTDLYTENPLDFLARCVFYRLTNLPKTWRYLRTVLGRYPVVSDFTVGAENLTSILHQYRDAGNRVFSGAYIIIPEPGTANDKISGAVRVAQRFVEDGAGKFLACDTQAERYTTLLSTAGIGNFLAMQILTDWGYGQDVSYENEFISAGPGAQRGAAHLNPTLRANEVIYDLTVTWSDEPLVQLGRASLSLMDVQNTLCEFSKYHRFAVAGKAYGTGGYRPAHPGPQPKPVLPVWMRSIA